MTAPFGFSWGTFASLVVVAGTIALAIIWSLLASRRDDGEGDGDE
jgi:hypothetical protein